MDPSTCCLPEKRPFSDNDQDFVQPIGSSKLQQRRKLEAEQPDQDDKENFLQGNTDDTLPSVNVEASLSPLELQEQILRNLRLRRILRENHGGEINAIAFHFRRNQTEGTPIGTVDTSNVVATAGGAQANIYDNEHCGDHLDIMSHFVLEEDKEGRNEILALCWIPRPDDALLAVAGQDRKIHILSIARSREIIRMEGHKGDILDLQLHPKNNNLLLSSSQDGTTRLWLIGSESGSCVGVYNTAGTVAAFNASGESFLTGSSSGELREWSVPDEIVLEAGNGTIKEIGKSESRLLFPSKKKLHSSAVDDLLYSPDGRVLCKFSNGKVEYFDPETSEVFKSFSLKSNNPCRMDISRDGNFFCVGSGSGTIYIYNLVSQKLVTELKHKRSIKAVRCCAFSKDARSILYGDESSCIWRYDYIDEETLKLWAADAKQA